MQLRHSEILHFTGFGCKTCGFNCILSIHCKKQKTKKTPSSEVLYDTLHSLINGKTILLRAHFSRHHFLQTQKSPHNPILPNAVQTEGIKKP